jgi:hypothetical protein
MSGELDAGTIRAWTRRTRAVRGLPPKITDPATLARLVTLALAPGAEPEPERDGGRPAGKGGDDGAP